MLPLMMQFELNDNIFFASSQKKKQLTPSIFGTMLYSVVAPPGPLMLSNCNIPSHHQIYLAIFLELLTHHRLEPLCLFCSVRYCRVSSYMYFCTHAWTAHIRLVNVCIYCTVLCCIIILGFHVLIGRMSSTAGSRRTLHGGSGG